MNINAIREIVEIMENSSLSELTIKEGNLELYLSKKQEVIRTEIIQPTAELTGIKDNMAVNPIETIEDENALYIESPLVGTYYSASSPDAPAYVKVGDIVKKGTVICILEAMKLMNEIECEYDCEIEAILVSNEQKVGYGQPLFRVRKI